MLEKTEDDDEVELLEDALDNLAFTEDMRNFAVLDVSGDETDLDVDLDDNGGEDIGTEDEDWEDEQDEGGPA